MIFCDSHNPKAVWLCDRLQTAGRAPVLGLAGLPIAVQLLPRSRAKHGYGTGEGNAEEEFSWRYRGWKVSRDGALPGACLTRDNAGERSDKASLPVPRAVEVVGHEADLVDGAWALRHVQPFVNAWAGTAGD